MTARDDFPYIGIKVQADEVPCVLMRATVYTSAMVEINRLRAENARLRDALRLGA